MKTTESTKPQGWRPLALIFLLLAAGIVAVGYFSYQIYEQRFRTGIEQELSVISELKVAQIVQWRHERLADANFLRHTPYSARRGLDVLAQPASLVTRQMFMAWLEALFAGGAYEQALLLDERLNVGAVYPERASGGLSAVALRAAQDALSSRQVVLTDLHRETEDGPVYLTIMIPLVVRQESTGDKVPAAGKGSSKVDRSAGLLILQINAGKELYPMIQTWPTPSRTAETLLVRRDGNDALFLNELRFRTNAALRFRASLESTNTPAVKAVLGQEGMVEGRDYRGVRVLAALRAVPDSPWFLVARMDTAEAYAPLRERLRLIILVVGALLLGAAASVGFVWRQQRIRFYRERHELAEELQWKTALLEAQMHSSITGILAVDPEGKKILQNQKVADLFQIPPNIAEDKDDEKQLLWVAGRAKDPAQFLEKVIQLNSQPNETSHDEIELKDGTVLNRDSTPLVGKDGKYYGRIWSFRDTTARKRVEEQLRVQASALDAAANAIVITDLHGTIQSVNPAFTALTGYTAAEAVGQNPRVLKAGNQDEAFYRNMWQTIAAGQVWSGELTNRRKDGSLYEEEMTITPVRDAQGAIVRYIAIKQDITGRKRAEEALRESKQIIEGILNAIPVRVFWKDKNLVYLGGNAIFARDAGFADPQDIIGKDDYQMGWRAQAELYRAGDREVIQSGNSRFLIEEPQTTPEGNIITLLTSKIPLRNAKGGINGVLGTYLDITDRKQAEEVLRQRVKLQDQLVQIAATVPGMIYSLRLRPDGSTQMPFASGVMSDIFDLQPKDVIEDAASIFALIHPDDIGHVQATMAESARTLTPWRDDFRVCRTRLEEIWVEGHSVPQREPDGSVLWHGFVQNITERKRAETALQESKRFLQSALNALSSHIAILDEHGTIIEVNTAWNRFAMENDFKGDSRGVGDNYLKVCDSASGSFSDGAAAVAGGIRAVMAGQSDEFHLEYPCHDGLREERWFSVRVTRFGDAIPMRLVVAHENITDRRQAEDRVRQSQARYRSLIDTAHDAIFTLEPDGTFISLNPAFETIMGVARAGWIGKPFAPLVHPDDLPLAVEMFNRILKGGPVPVYELRGNPGLTRPLILEVTLAAQKDGSGKILSVLGIGRDITERKRFEARLFQAQKMETVGKLAGGVAHEFNSILTAIIGQSELILGDLPSGHPLTQNADGIRQAAGRAATLTRQLLAYGRKTFLRPEALELNQVLASLEGTIRHLMGEDVNVRVVPAKALLAVNADAGQIEQVIMNLAMNAADAMPNGGNLTLETASVSFDPESLGRYPELKPGDYVMLAITDTGTGMSEEVKRRAFEPFFSTKGVGQGTGLGLSTCYGIIKQSGGHISVYSEPGRGTTFKVYLPQVASPAKIPLQRLDSPDLPRGTETILLVEDDPALREMATNLLRRLGYTVFAAANGVEALSLKHERSTGHIDLLFTDVVMPHMSGKELADRVRALYPRTRILFTSAYTEQAIVHQGVLDPGVALLQKPFTPSALARKLREILDQPCVPQPDAAQRTFGFTKGKDGVNTP